jgi:hypothetical protein
MHFNVLIRGSTADSIREAISLDNAGRSPHQTISGIVGLPYIQAVLPGQNRKLVISSQAVHTTRSGIPVRLTVACVAGQQMYADRRRMLTAKCTPLDYQEQQMRVSSGVVTNFALVLACCVLLQVRIRYSAAR